MAMKRRRMALLRTTNQSLLGAVLIVSCFATGVLTFALGTSLLGEERLGTGSGLTVIGLVFFLVPAAVGLALITLDVLGIRMPRLQLRRPR
ncbi:MAG: hypothetical protein ACR2P0_04915 [Acidimicrobiales bacterium]